MVYPTIGISIFAHMIIVGTVKVKNFLRFGKTVKTKGKAKTNNFLKKVVAPMAVATIIWSVLILVIGSSAAAVDVGLTSKESNLNIIDGAIHNLENSAKEYNCTVKKICYFNNTSNAISLPG